MVLNGTYKLTKIQRQMLDEQIKYLQTISISIGNHSILQYGSTFDSIAVIEILKLY